MGAAAGAWRDDRLINQSPKGSLKLRALVVITGFGQQNDELRAQVAQLLQETQYKVSRV